MAEGVKTSSLNATARLHEHLTMTGGVWADRDNQPLCLHSHKESSDPGLDFLWGGAYHEGYDMGL